MRLEDTIKFCKDWFAENNIQIPKTVREWNSGRSGKTIPPGCTYATLRKQGIKVSEVLNGLLGSASIRAYSTISDDTLCSGVGLTFLGKEGKENILYSCNSCGGQYSTRKGTIKRWSDKNQCYCSMCRSASGKTKPIEYYDKFLTDSFKALSYNKGIITILHKPCGTSFTRTNAHVQSLDGSTDLQCPCCSESLFSSKTKDGFMSIVERDCILHLQKSFPLLDVEREKLYSDIIDTDRKFRADVFIPTLGVVIEITSKGNNLPKYSERLKEKINLLESKGILVYVATSKNEIEDIVRTLLKDREM